MNHGIQLEKTDDYGPEIKCMTVSPVHGTYSKLYPPFTYLTQYILHKVCLPYPYMVISIYVYVYMLA